MKTVATQLSRVVPAGLAMLFLVLANVYGQAGAPPAAAPAPSDFQQGRDSRLQNSARIFIP